MTSLPVFIGCRGGSRFSHLVPRRRVAYNRSVLVSDFNFELPPEQIAQQPPETRGTSRMLTLSRTTGAWRDRLFQELPELLIPGDLLVLNESRVIPARLFAQRMGRDGEVEVLLSEQMSPWEWRTLTRPARKLPVGEKLAFVSPEGESVLEAEVISRGDFGERIVRFTPVEDFFMRLDRIGHMPLPPYIRRGDQPLDRERYQTVFAAEPGSVAAPTAGLHFTHQILERIRARGIRICSLTLHVGLGTFQPVRAETVEEIHLHAERYSLPEKTAAEVNQALREGRRIIAAGTTTVRTLEHCAQIGRLEAHSGATSIFLAPGSQFRVVTALVTNFHLPRSTLMMLVSAFAGREQVLAAYRHAVAAGYRFFSYGDCMFVG
jgi:S-adenosylmethionine:tRNA ribosyltransferase-isomerase